MIRKVLSNTVLLRNTQLHYHRQYSNEVLSSVFSEFISDKYKIRIILGQDQIFKKVQYLVLSCLVWFQLKLKLDMEKNEKILLLTYQESRFWGWYRVYS